MSEPQPLPLDVEYVIDSHASSDEVDSVTNIALEEGVPGQVRAALSQKSIDDMPWIVYIFTPCSASTTFAGSVNYSCRFTPCFWLRCWATPVR